MATGAKMALLGEYALIARALGAPHRLIILEQLAQGERSVEALADKVGLTVANCSHHLQQLRRAGLATSRREGKSVIYRLTDDRTLALMDGLRQVAERTRAQVGDILRGLSGDAEAPEPIGRSDLALRLAEGSVTLLDVRPDDEYRMSHIPGAIHVAPGDLDRLLAETAPSGEIVAYCRGPYCLYAHEAVTHLRKLGLNARRLDGGLPEWRADGRVVVAGSAA